MLRLLLIPFAPLLFIALIVKGVNAEWKMRQYAHGLTLLHQIETMRELGYDDTLLVQKLDQHTRRMRRLRLIP